MGNSSFGTSHPTSRRRFLARAGAAMGVSSLVGIGCTSIRDGNVGQAKPPLFPVIDTHTHFYDPTRPEGVPWPGKKETRLYRPVFPKEYRQLAEPEGVVGTVVVEASPWVEDNQWLLDLAKGEPYIVGIVGNLNPGEEGFKSHLERFARDPVYRGIRISHDSLMAGLDRPGYLDDINRLADQDLTLDVNGGPDMPADVARLADKIELLRIVINHVANVRIDGEAPPEAWTAGMRAAAAHPRVYCKFSGLMENAVPRDGRRPLELSYYQPVLDVVWKAFGENRLIYGSNWPVSDLFCPYEDVHHLAAGFACSKGEAATRRIMHDNSMSAYKWLKRQGNA